MKRAAVLLLSSAMLLSPQLIASDSEEVVDFFPITFQGQSRSLIELRRALGLQGDEVLVYFVYPQVAARIESVMHDSYAKLRPLFKGDVIGVINYPKYWYAKQYVVQRRFPFKCIIDTAFKFWREIAPDLSPQTPPIVTRWSKDGHLLGKLTLYGPVQYTDVLKPISSSARHTQPLISQSGYNADKFRFPVPTARQTILIQEDSTQFFGAIQWFKPELSTNKVFLHDGGRNQWLIYDVVSKRIAPVVLGLATRKLFSPELSDSLFLEYERVYPFAQLIPMDGMVVDSCRFLFVCVFPNLTFRFQDSDTILAAWTRHAFVHYDYCMSQVRKVARIQFDTLYQRTNLGAIIYSKIISNGNKEVPFAVDRGYPTKGFIKPHDTAWYDNPFKKEFYTHAPLFATFNYETGELVRTIGQLAESHQKLAMGYFMAAPLLCFVPEEDYCIIQSLTDYVETAKRRIPIKSYYEPSLLPQNVKAVDSLPDIAFYHRIADSAKAGVIDLGYGAGNLYLLWRLKEQGKRLDESEILILQVYDFASGALKKEYRVPYHYNGATYSTSYLDAARGSLWCVYSTALSTLLVEYGITN